MRDWQINGLESAAEPECVNLPLQQLNRLWLASNKLRLYIILFIGPSSSFRQKVQSCIFSAPITRCAPSKLKSYLHVHWMCGITSHLQRWIIMRSCGMTTDLTRRSRISAEGGRAVKVGVRPPRSRNNGRRSSGPGSASVRPPAASQPLVKLTQGLTCSSADDLLPHAAGAVVGGGHQ